MDAYETILTKLDVRVFASRPVEGTKKEKILEAARSTGSSMNSQHWRFVLIQEPRNLETLSRDSTTGSWVKKSDFAVIVAIDPSVPGSAIDAGRAAQDMQVAAWNLGVASGLFTGIRKTDLKRDFGIPEGLDPAVVVGFGYPSKKIIGRKSRKPLSELAFLEKFGKPIGSLGN